MDLPYAAAASVVYSVKNRRFGADPGNRLRWIFGLLGMGAGGGMIGSIIVAFVGAVILVGITRLIKRA